MLRSFPGRAVARPFHFLFRALRLAWAAARCHLLSGACTLFFMTVSAALLGIDVPVALGGWLTVGVLSLFTWNALEVRVLRLLGARPLSRLERERLSIAFVALDDEAHVEGGAAEHGEVGVAARSVGARVGAEAVGMSRALDGSTASVSKYGKYGTDVLGVESLSPQAPFGWAAPNLEVLVVPAAKPWFGRGLRCVVLSTPLLDLLEDRAVAGFLYQTAAPVWPASVAGEWMVWLGTIPMVAGWLGARLLAQLGRLLAVEVGASLRVPLVLWPTGFTRVAGSIFGAMFVGMLGLVLLSSGLAAAGLGLLIGWSAVPGVHALLAWERRRTEAQADHATLRAGLGWPLLEAMETLTWAVSLPRPGGVFGLLCRPGTPFADRADRLWKWILEVEPRWG